MMIPRSTARRRTVNTVLVAATNFSTANASIARKPCQPQNSLLILRTAWDLVETHHVLPVARRPQTVRIMTILTQS